MINRVDKIVQILAEKLGLKAKEIAGLLHIKKKEVNSILYGVPGDKLFKDASHRWWLNTAEIVTKDSEEECSPLSSDTELAVDKGQELEIKTGESIDVNHNDSRESDNIQDGVIDDSQDINNDDLIIDSYRDYSLPYPTAEEERELWERYIKWRHIKEILSSESIHDEITRESSIVISHIAKEISASSDLVALLRRHAGLEKLGDRILEDTASKTNDMVELYRLIQYSKNKLDEKLSCNDGEPCLLEDFLGYFFGEILNNIVFGKGNPNLVDKIIKENNENLANLKEQLCRLAVDRSLLPRDLMKFVDLKIPLSSLPKVIKDINPDFFSANILNNYELFISNIKFDGERAFNKIIESHLRLVMNSARKLIVADINLSIDDAIQEGSIGLIKAAEKYNPTYGIRFMSYAPWWIIQAINRAIADQTRTIRIPTHMVETINNLLKVTRRLTQEYGREPTYAEIAEEMDISVDKIREIIKASQLPDSLDLPTGADDDRTLGSSIEGENATSLVDLASNELLKEQIEDVLYTLTPREQRVLQLRFGLEDGRSRTLEEVGREFNVTRERIRQIEAKALRKLRHPSRSGKLKEFVDDPAAHKRKKEKSADVVNEESEPICDSGDIVSDDTNDYESD